jgi:hypothetical protein
MRFHLTIIFDMPNIPNLSAYNIAHIARKLIMPQAMEAQQLIRSSIYLLIHSWYHRIEYMTPEAFLRHIEYLPDIPIDKTVDYK